MEKKRRGLRFGVIAVEKGFIASEELVRALKIQVEENLSTGKHRLIGMILLEEDLLTLDQIDEILHALHK